MKKLLTALLIAMPLTACDASKELREENQRLVQENQDLKVRLARLEERAKATTAPQTTTTAAVTPAKPKAKPKATATKAPEEASPEEKAALTEAATGGGSFK